MLLQKAKGVAISPPVNRLHALPLRRIEHAAYPAEVPPGALEGSVAYSKVDVTERRPGRVSPRPELVSTASTH